MVWARLRRRPFVVSLMGFPDRESVGLYRGRGLLIRRAHRAAAATFALSQAAAEALREATGLSARPLPPGVRTADFAPRVGRAEQPTIFCAASLADPRKRVRMLVDAFGRLRRSRPDARLVLDAASTGGALPPWAQGEGVEARTQDLADAYARAWTAVLPSEREAFGLVLVEALAAGTPVVGAAAGAIPEVITDGRVGRLFDPHSLDALVRALDECLAVSRFPATAEACRAHAARWDWSLVGPRYLNAYREAAGA